MADRATVPQARRWTRPGIVIGAVLVIAAVALASCVSLLVATPMSKTHLRSLFTDKVRRVGGLSAEVGGEATLVLLPKPHISLTNVEVSDAARAVQIHAARVRVDLSLLPLLWNALDVADVIFDGPIFDVDLDRRARVEAEPIAAIGDGRESAFGQIHVRDGEAVLHRAVKADIRLLALNGLVDWRTAGASAVANGTFRLDDQSETLDAWVAAPASLLAGGTSPLRIRIVGATLDLSVTGVLDTQHGTAFSGRTSARAPELSVLLRMLDIGRPDIPPLGPCALSADVAVDKLGATLAGLRLRVASNDFEGSLAIGSGPQKPAIAGTLAVATLDLGPLVATFPPLRDGNRRWNADPLDVSGLDLADVDVRISTVHTRIARTDIADAALSLMVRDRALDLTLADGRIDNGAAKGRVTMTPRGEGIDVQASGSFAGADFADLLGAGGASGLAGRLAGTFSVASSGRSFAALVAGAHGRSDFSVDAGRIGGIDIEQNLRRFERSEGTAHVRFGGATSFDTAKFGIDLAGGTARIDTAALAGPGARLNMTGTIDLPAQALDIAGVATRAGTDGAVTADGPRLDLRLAGPWSAPVFEATPALAVPPDPIP